MNKIIPVMTEGLRYATIYSVEKGEPVRIEQGLVESIWITFVTDEQEEIKTSILVYERSPLLEHFLNATVGLEKRTFFGREFIGYYCLIDIKIDYNRMIPTATVIKFYGIHDQIWWDFETE